MCDNLSEMQKSFRVIDASLGYNHTLILTEDGSVYSGGIGTHGELGIELKEDMLNVIVQNKSNNNNSCNSNNLLS